MMKLIKLTLIAAIAFLTTMGFNKWRFHYDWNNAAWRTLMTPFTGTVWAPDFTEEGFSKIKTGMTMREVEAVVGKPLKGYMTDFWIYSNQTTGTADYDRRWVSFDSDGEVRKIQHLFYID